MRSVIQTRSWRIMRDLSTRRNIGPPPGPPLESGRRPALGDGRPAQNLGSETPRFPAAGPARSAGEKFKKFCPVRRPRPTGPDKEFSRQVRNPVFLTVSLLL